MKNKFSFKTISFVFVISVCMLSCNLVEVGDIAPVNQLSEDQAITTVSQAQSVLIGTYGQIKGGLEIVCYYPGTAALMGGTMDPGPSAGTGEAAFKNNDPDPENFTIDAIYTKWYKVLNNANHIIEKTPLIQTNDVRKDEVIGEAKFIRALAHFYLLRFYGQFYDANSTFGIVLKDKPVRSATPQARATVKQCYDLILADLDDAIAKAPSFNKTVYASRQVAMAMKAKVLLYMKNYAEAASLAQQVIQSGAFQLEAKFSDVFIKKIVNTKEAMFQTPYDDKNDRGNKAFIMRSSYQPSPYYAGILLGDNRDTAALIRNANGTFRNKKFNGTVFNGQTLTADTEYFLRLAEMYLIQAEAIVRNNGNLADARSAVNTLRTRALMAPVTSNDKAELLQLIRREKILELGCESGEEWFDLVRYAVAGDLDIKTIKPGVTSPDKYILPIPYNSVQLSQGVVIQNPNY